MYEKQNSARIPVVGKVLLENAHVRFHMFVKWRKHLKTFQPNLEIEVSILRSLNLTFIKRNCW